MTHNSLRPLRFHGRCRITLRSSTYGLCPIALFVNDCMKKYYRSSFVYFVSFVVNVSHINYPRAYRASKIPAAPIPVPIHMVTMP